MTFDQQGNSVLEFGVDDKTEGALFEGVYAFAADRDGTPHVAVRVHHHGEAQLLRGASAWSSRLEEEGRHQ